MADQHTPEEAKPEPPQLGPRQLATLASAAGVHVGAAVACILAVVNSQDQPLAKARSEWMKLCAELFDEAAKEIGLG